MVSVCMTTYYHEAYIAQAIESILSQKVDFRYEIIICDDCSKDGTQAIIKEYAEKNPCIRYVFNDPNLGLTKNVFQAKCMAEGKYIVPLSGDDYWIDDHKLQRQVDFLERNPEYIGIADRIEIREEDSQNADFIDPPPKICGKSFELKDYLKGKNFPTNGFLMRNIIKERYDMFSLMPQISPFIDDETDCILILKTGNIYISKDVTVAYRKRIEQKGQKNFNSINKGITKLKKHIDLLNNLYAEFGKEMDLFGRYKVALGPEIAKHYRPGTAKRFREIIKTIPAEYRKRGIVAGSVFYIIPKTVEVLTRKYKG